MRRFATALLLLATFASCTTTPEPGYRDQSAHITSSSRFTAESFAGDWAVVDYFPTKFFASCAGQSWRLSQAAAGTYDFSTACAGSSDPNFYATAQIDPKGRLLVETSDLSIPERALWVLWVDEDARTAVVGTPSGEMGWILNRTPNLRADRLKAAREILKFNGYDLSRLIRASQ